MFPETAATLDPVTLVGSWPIERAIVLATGEVAGRVQGSATFDQGADGVIRWFERGVFDWRGTVTPVENHLELRRSGPGGWDVHFADGRYFHPWRIAEAIVHDCAPDVYRGEISRPVPAASSPWTVRWQVRGPDKDYTIESRYERASTV